MTTPAISTDRDNDTQADGTAHARAAAFLRSLQAEAKRGFHRELGAWVDDASGAARVLFAHAAHDEQSAAQSVEHSADEALARVLTLHRRRAHTANGGESMGGFDFVHDGQTEFPDLCDHCKVAWPCATATTIQRDLT